MTSVYVYVCMINDIRMTNKHINVHNMQDPTTAYTCANDYLGIVKWIHVLPAFSTGDVRVGFIVGPIFGHLRAMRGLCCTLWRLCGGPC